MIRVSNPSLDRLILDHLTSLYKLKTKRSGTHLSTLLYCLTRSYFDQTSPIEPTDEEVMLFALGLGLQDEFTPADAIVPVYEKEGITFSPDFVLKLNGSGYNELKTTRASMKKFLLDGGIPETWIEYIKGGCYMMGVKEYNLAVLFMMGNYAPPFPTVHSETLVFEPEELAANWDYLLTRKAVYEQSLTSKHPPEPFKYCKKWECEHCRYYTICSALAIVIEGESDADAVNRS